MNSILWILLASFLGFGIAATFAGWLKLKLNLYLLVYIPLIFIVFMLFILKSDYNISHILSHNWYWGLVGAVVASGFVIKNVLSQPPSERQKGFALVTDVVWPGFSYGLVDSLLLSVLPVLAVQSFFTNDSS